MPLLGRNSTEAKELASLLAAGRKRKTVGRPAKDPRLEKERIEQEKEKREQELRTVLEKSKLSNWVNYYGNNKLRYCIDKKIECQYCRLNNDCNNLYGVLVSKSLILSTCLVCERYSLRATMTPAFIEKTSTGVSKEISGYVCFACTQELNTSGVSPWDIHGNR